MDAYPQNPDAGSEFTTIPSVELPDVENSSLVDLLRYWAAHYPDQVAITFLVDGETQEATLTYAQWDAKARQIAGVLQGKARFGDRALLIYPNNLEFLAGFMGTMTSPLHLCAVATADYFKAPLGKLLFRVLLSELFMAVPVVIIILVS